MTKARGSLWPLPARPSCAPRSSPAAPRARSGSEPRSLRGPTSPFRGAAGWNQRRRRRRRLFLPKAMWPAGAGTKLPCPRDSALRRAAFSGNLTALPSHLVPAGRSVRVFVSANPEGKSLGSVGPSVRPRGGIGTEFPQHSRVWRASAALPSSSSCSLGCPERSGIPFESLLPRSSLRLPTPPRTPILTARVTPPGRAEKRPNR